MQTGQYNAMPVLWHYDQTWAESIFGTALWRLPLQQLSPIPSAGNQFVQGKVFHAITTSNLKLSRSPGQFFYDFSTVVKQLPLRKFLLWQSISANY
jgi:hypothetical protein